MNTKLAVASKDQMKIWKAASKDGTRQAINHILLDIITKNEETRGYLVATDGWVLAKREVAVEFDITGPLQINIPREAIANAEKVMQKGDVAHIYENQIIVTSIFVDESTSVEDFTRKAVVPFQSQMSIVYPTYDHVLHGSGNDLPETILTIDAAILRAALTHVKHGSNAVWLHLRINPGSTPEKPSPVVMTAFEHLSGESITVAAMPIKEK